MSYKQAFFWGKLSGLLAGALIGIIGGVVLSISWMAAPEMAESQREGLILISPFVGGFVSGAIGALFGTLLAIFIVWERLLPHTTAVSTAAGAVIGFLLLSILAPYMPYEPYLLPLLGFSWGGSVGWINGRFLAHKANVIQRAKRV